jgi:membrane protein
MGLVYATLLSLVPAIAFSFAVLKAFDAHGGLEPIVYEFFKPMGSGAAEFTDRVMEFADSVSTGLVGSLGFVLLLWTLLGTVSKVEDGFNFLWRVEHARSFARRLAECLILLVVGPIALVSIIGLSHDVLDLAAAGWGRHLPFFDRMSTMAIEVSSYFLVAGIFTALYILVPNTKVKLIPALIGGVSAGILWATVGQLFTELVVSSTRLTVVYAGFAIIVVALLWTYASWLILLVGAQLSFYVQNRHYLRLGLTELRLSAVQREQFSLEVMYLIARAYHDGKPRWSIDGLAHELGMPGIAVSRIVDAFEAAHLLAIADDECLLPARDIGQITIKEILDVARNERAGQVAPRDLELRPVDEVRARMDTAWRASCGDMTLRDLIEDGNVDRDLQRPLERP